MQGELRVNLLQQRLEPVRELPVPRQEARLVVDVGRRVNLVLLEPNSVSRRGSSG
jgi:hypothetical protein